MKWVVLGFWLVVATASPARQALQVIVTLIPGSGGWSTISTTIAQFKQIASGVPPGLSMHVIGSGGFAAESSEAFSGVDGKLTGEVVSSTQPGLLMKSQRS